MEKEQQMGYLRDRTAQYKTYRSGTAKSRGSYKSQLEDELNPTLAPEFGTSSNVVEKSNMVETKFNMIQMEIQNLADMHKQRKRIDFGNDRKLDLEIEAKTQQISTQIQQLRDAIRITDPNLSKQSRTIQNNMQYGYSARLRDITIHFRDMQADYIKTIKKQKDRAARFEDDDNDDGVLDDIDDVAFTDQQIAQVKSNENMLRQRNEELTNLIGMMNQLNQLFADLGTVLVEQGTMLDRIDGKVEEAAEEIKKGNVQLQKADHHQSSKCFYWYMIIVILLIIIFGGIIIGKKMKKSGGGSSPTPVPNVTNIIKLL
ncbi:syntaxin 16/TLG2-like protein, putative [Trichomonas vaginalis G3]|uniref:Syntaxin 16/TLG2-like protein, putative n=1 Tax=Trichomonas vaginalis (strain ATCC PRA-98 / G3) TaxID=412133 RepID=A2FEX9_TRIV3|nr:SNAP receptor protein [Trichomonas vaginalis G3]EAX96533.1 syntaxin 16/TLG2-like protein, putative [Trichomonas vaginalis G3]KAI5541099.1 SNAP receptor protein [Trichomonas vaginalis G3]|eukprot:XP_001309463.1 syntaxin 16/TLG2-like protein [Trichomonas vaginalis G3]